MLVLTRKIHQAVRIGEAVVTVVDCGAGKVRIGIEAPRDVKVLRCELIDGGPYGSNRIDDEQRKAG